MYIKLELCTGREAKGISSKKLARFEYNRVQRVKDNIVGAGVIGGTVHSRYYPVSFHWSRTANYIVELASIRIYGLLITRRSPSPARTDQRMRPRTHLVERRKKSI